MVGAVRWCVNTVTTSSRVVYIRYRLYLLRYQLLGKT